MMLEASGMEHIAKHISFTSGSGSFHDTPEDVNNNLPTDTIVTELDKAEPEIKTTAIKEKAAMKTRKSVMPNKISPELNSKEN